MFFGWAGRILRVDLKTGKIKAVPLSKELAVNFIGGRGFNSKILYDEVKLGIDPLGSENKLIFGTGPLTGTLIPCSGRWTVTAKSPVTDAFGDGNAGGHWGAELKWAGYDVIVLENQAERPSYLWIDDDHVELRDATHVWGFDVWETNEIIKEDIGDTEIKVASIGPAGENLVNAACVLSDYTRAAGKCGIGAVMGSKNLKAVAIRGTKGVTIANPKEFERVVEEGIEMLKIGDKWWFENFSYYGTPIFYLMNEYFGRQPTKNWSDGGIFEKVEALHPDLLMRKYIKKKRACNSCIFQCSGYYLIEDGPYAGTTGEGFEWEALGGYGVKLGNANMESTLVCKTLADKLGLDVISSSEVIAWAMECYNKGLLTEKDTDDLDLTWGNHEAIIASMKKLAYKDGQFGELLALGSRKAAEKVGKGAEQYSMTIKAQQMGCGDPRASWAWALGYGTSTRGGDHLRAQPVIEWLWTPEMAEEVFGTTKVLSRLSHEGKGIVVSWFENIRAINDSLEVCKYLIRGNPDMFLKWPVKAMRTVTGVDFDEKTLMKCGERIFNVEKAFNTMEGLSRKDDYLPERYYTQPMPKGPIKGTYIPKEKWDAMLDEYYDTRGWDKNTGFQTREKLEELGLKYIADELEHMGKLSEGKEKSEGQKLHSLLKS